MKWFGKKEKTEKHPLGLYVHIPFCVRKCNYCDFLSAPADQEKQNQYLDALSKEIEGYHEYCKNHTVKTVYFGGGTPSILDANRITQLLETIKKEFDTQFNEVTLEVNPGTVTQDKLIAYKAAGVNRLSIGMQSANDEELKLLGRIHTFEQVKQCFSSARTAGFQNISLDVMSALPNQTLQSYQNTLEQVIALQPEHISSYSLMIEEGTPFYEQYADKAPLQEQLPSEELDRQMYAKTKQMLQEAGYLRYEISNYAKPGYESRHNSSYWTGIEYIGLGLGASSLFTNARYHNETDLEAYIRNCVQGEDVRRDIERLVESEQMEEFMILGLRMMSGISRLDFQNRFGRAIETVYGTALSKLRKEELIEQTGDIILLTEKGIDVSNRVFVEFVPEDFVRR